MRTWAIIMAAVAGAFLSGEGWSANAGKWSYSREVRLGSSPPADCLASIVLSPEIAGRCLSGMSDIELVDPSGREVPFLIDRPDGANLGATWPLDVVSELEVAGGKTTWILDMAEPRLVDRVDIELPGGKYLKTARLESERADGSWRTLRESAPVFGGQPGDSDRCNSIVLRNPSRVKRLRLTVDNRREPPLDPSGFRAVATDRVSGMRWAEDVIVRKRAPERDMSYGYRLVARRNMVYDRVSVDFADRSLSRGMEVYERVPFRDPRAVEARKNPKPGVHRGIVMLGMSTEPEFDMLSLGRAHVFRARLGRPALTVESLEIPVGPHTGGEIWLEVENDHSPAPKELKVTASGICSRLLFIPEGRKYTLRYGNISAKPKEQPVNLIQQLLQGGAPILETTLLNPSR